jgi:hypothetical protein
MPPIEGFDEQSGDRRGKHPAAGGRRRVGRWLQIAVTAAIAALIATAIPAIAAAAKPSVTYFACVTNSTGAIRMVGSNAVCRPGKHKISWNNTGPQGPQGVPGKTGSTGPAGAVTGFIDINDPNQQLDSNSRTVATLPLPAGDYLITAKLLANIGTTQASPDNVDCDLVDSDGNLLDFAIAALGLGQNYTAIEPMTLLGATQLATNGNVQIQCADESSNADSVVDAVRITAVPVTGITQSAG